MNSGYCSLIIRNGNIKNGQIGQLVNGRSTVGRGFL